MDPAGALDRALDRMVAPGYGRAGLAIRRRLPGWQRELPRMDGETVLVTGAAGGIGLAAAIGFAGLGAHVHVLARSRERARDAVEAVGRAVPGAAVHGEACDASNLAALREFSRDFSSRVQRLDVLVNNAGVMPPHRTHTAEGHEAMFATHVLGPFALTEWLLERLAAAAPSSVINVSSGGMYTRAIDAADPESERVQYSPAGLYARTKRAEVVISELWAEKLDERGVAVHVMHPGWVDTQGVRDALPAFRALTRPLLRSPEQGADTIVWLGAMNGRLAAGRGIWCDRVLRPDTHPLGPAAPSEEERHRLWSYCSQAVAARAA